MSDIVEKYIQELSLEEKAQQLSQSCGLYLNESKAENTGLIGDIHVSKSELYNVGSVLNFLDARDMKSLADLCMENTTTGIPPIFMHDVVHGYRTIYPVPLAMAGTFDTDVVEDCAEMAAKEALTGGVQVTFAPMVDLVRDARWGRVMESAGEDPYLGGVMGRAQIRGFKKGGLMTCVKHFAAYGAVEAGRDYNTTDISDYNLYEFYLRGYQECLKENPEMVMTSFNLLNGIPMNGHTDLLIGLLREKWGFNGVVISDYTAISEMCNHGYTENEERCAEIALNNEVDIEMVSTTYMQYLPKLVKEGKVSEEKVNRMLRRVLELKKNAGLFDNPYQEMSAEKEQALCVCEEHRAIVRKAAEKAIVLLKNDGVLPLSKQANIRLVGHMAQEKRVAGEWSCHYNAEECVTVFEGLRNLLGKAVGSEGGEIAIACIGEKSTMSGESASKANIEVSQEDVMLLKNLHNAGKKTVAVIFAGRPLCLTQIEPYCDAIVYAWFLGTESGNAIANVLFGEASPSAKLTMSFPRMTGQCPIYYNYFNTGRPKEKDDNFCPHMYNSSYLDTYNSPLYPFGYGLTYTNITLSDMKISDKTIAKNGKITVRLSLKNEGERDGEEVVQLYIRDTYASVVRPVKELKGYQKVLVKAKERRTVTFELTEETLRYYRNKDEFLSELGEFEIMVGLNSRDVLSEKITRI